MESVKARSATPPWVWLVMGSLCFTFVGWRFNVPLAAWLAPVFLMRFFRDRGRWFESLAAVPLLAVGSFIQMNGGWDLDPWMVYLFSVLRPAAFVIALFVDRALYRKLPKTASTLVYPTVYLVVDYAIALTPLGSGMSAVHDLGAKQTDIVLVPAFDTERIRPYHTEVGLMRALENGFSVVRQVNKGTSMAVDGSGRVLGRQEFFETQDRLMIVDVPTRRVSTLYSAVGEWLAYAGVALAVLFVIRGAAKSFR